MKLRNYLIGITSIVLGTYLISTNCANSNFRKNLYELIPKERTVKQRRTFKIISENGKHIELGNDTVIYEKKHSGTVIVTSTATINSLEKIAEGN